MNKQLLQRALDALEYGLPCMGVGQRSKACSAIEALRAAIEAPESEPVFYWDGDPVGLQDCLDYTRNDTHKYPLYRDPPDAEAKDAALRRDAERFAWILGPESEADNEPDSMRRGLKYTAWEAITDCGDNYTPDQKRAAIDAAINAKEQTK